MENYKKIKALGKGTWGVVHMAKQTTTGCFVSIKKIKSERPEEGWVCSKFVISSSPRQTHTAALFVDELDLDDIILLAAIVIVVI
eukprot:6829946-Ditylum_brightwellii.AAC.1